MMNKQVGETCSAEELKRRINAAVELAVRFGGIQETHHIAWVVDQMVRALAGDDYESIVTFASAGDDGPNTYSWDVGTPP